MPLAMSCLFPRRGKATSASVISTRRQFVERATQVGRRTAAAQGKGKGREGGLVIRIASLNRGKGEDSSPLPSAPLFRKRGRVGESWSARQERTRILVIRSAPSASRHSRTCNRPGVLLPHRNLFLEWVG
uniref:Uncharacterized protein ORF129 n=1 Tax=Nothoceros aenigmaticus TaxID=13813 RepID=C3RYM7_9EMBR|nr:hypothetical protein MeaeMp21 [Nothoceros aenigmaticus]ACC86783.1 hypothetical protein MeaeMp21 [Nothoceros aenigmaticus]